MSFPADVKTIFINNPSTTGPGSTGIVVVPRPCRVFGCMVARGDDDNGKVNLYDALTQATATGTAGSGTVVLEFECGNATDQEEIPFMFQLPGGTAIRCETGLYVKFQGDANPNSITVIYQ